MFCLIVSGRWDKNNRAYSRKCAKNKFGYFNKIVSLINYNENDNEKELIYGQI